MAKNKFIKSIPKAKNKSMFRANEGEYPDRTSILFSLERMQDGKYCFTNLDQADKAAFAGAIFKRRSLTWNKIHQLNRHQLGYEKIAITSIHATIPKFITEDSCNLIVFRYNGMKAMVGYRIKSIFYALWFDFDFTLYNH